ncbi:MAG: 16S rRNA (uracil(1498)-N(3))-methyltransferase [bacterium]|nr:16S rRNA (uracil(1498)-N(3))-methyltransferase [bacterium]
MAAPERRFLISHSNTGVPESLAPEELHHARNVVRLRPGDAIVGLDGRGGRYPLRVLAVDRHAIAVEPTGEAEHEPAPGEAGAPLPRIIACAPLPKGPRAEAMIDRLTQLGVAAIVPLVTERAAEGARELSRNRRERLERTAREACKQSIRTWFPVLAEPAPLAQVLAEVSGGACLLEPRAAAPFRGWCETATPAAWTLAVGPEGGWTEEERKLARDAGAQEARLAPHVLRVETAIEAAVAALVQRFV